MKRRYRKVQFWEWDHYIGRDLEPERTKWFTTPDGFHHMHVRDMNGRLVFEVNQLTK